MRFAAFAIAAMLISAPLANAGGVDSAKFAEVYCRLVRGGASQKEAFGLAHVSAYRSNIRSTDVFYNGKKMRSDLFKAAIAIADECPEYVH